MNSSEIDFSEYCEWDDQDNEEYIAETKRTWTNNAKESYEDGFASYLSGKRMDQNPFIWICQKRGTLPNDPQKESEANTVLKHSMDPKNTMSKIGDRFRHNLEWWKRGWKAAYHDRTQTSTNKEPEHG